MHRRPIAMLLASALAVFAATPAFAGKGGKGAGSSSSIDVVVLGSSSSVLSDAPSPAHGGDVTFDVQTSADRPYILLNCYRGDEWLYSAQGFWSESSLPVFTLASSWWTSGGAECAARLGVLNADGTRFKELASTSFSVSG